MNNDTKATVLKQVSKIVLSTFAQAEIITLIFFLFVRADSDFNMKTSPAITFSNFLIILLFSLILSVANLLFSAKSIAPILKIILHYVIICGDFFLALYMMRAFGFVGSATIFVLFLFFSFVYFLVLFIRHLILRADKTKKTANKSTYSKQF